MKNSSFHLSTFSGNIALVPTKNCIVDFRGSANEAQGVPSIAMLPFFRNLHAFLSHNTLSES